MDDRKPDPQPSGALVPPPRVPPAVVATSAPLPPRPRRPFALQPDALRDRLAELGRVALDELDRLGDRIASAAGLR